MIKEHLVKTIQPYAARFISSNTVLEMKRWAFEMKRCLLNKDHHIDIYLRINDPYSYLLVQVMADFEQRYTINIEFKVIQNLQLDMYPEEAMWHDNGFIDASHLAKLYRLKFPAAIPEKNLMRVKQGTGCLLQLEQLQLEQFQLERLQTEPLKSKQEGRWQQVSSVFEQYWFQQRLSLDPVLECSSDLELDPRLEQRLAQNEQYLHQQGHYMSAMLHYAGEWYWGLDRLDHLEKRLNALGLAHNKKTDEVVFNKTYINFCQQPPLIAPSSAQKNKQSDKKLVLFFSIRSPYSYIGLQQAIKLAEYYQLPLEIKPILPMIMRGLLVPKVKKMYIFHDTKREAQKLGLDYGFVADPLGAGVERCYCLFSYAQSLGCEQQFILNYALAVNAQGIRAETDAGLKLIVQRSGMDWVHAQTLLTSSDIDSEWRQWVEDNRQQMLGQGSWGVPSFQYGDLLLWGQDRIGIIEQVIREDRRNSE